MALNRQQAVTRAMFRLRRLVGQFANQISYEDIDSYQSDAMQRLVEKVIAKEVPGASWVLPHKLTQNISPVSANIFKIPETIEVQSITAQGQVTANGGSGTGNPLQWLPNLEDCQLGGLSPEWEYYTITRGTSVGGAILTFKSDGSNFLPTTINIAAAVYPGIPTDTTTAFTDLPVALENDYVDILVEVAREKMGQMPQDEGPARQPATAS